MCQKDLGEEAGAEGLEANSHGFERGVVRGAFEGFEHPFEPIRRGETGEIGAKFASPAGEVGFLLGRLVLGDW